MQNPPTIFISGSGRSGTNITKAIFAEHSLCITLPFEYRFTVDPGGIVDFINQYSSNWSPFMADKRLRDLEYFLLSLGKRDEDEFAVSSWLKKVDRRAEKITPHSYAGWELEQWMPGYKSMVMDLMNQLKDFKYKASWPGSDSLQTNNKMYFGKPKTKKELITIFSKFLSECFASILQKSNKEVFVEDNTWSFLFAKDILDLVPNGKILHIIRDPRDVVASLIKQRWTPTDFDHIVVWYKSVMATWETQKAQLNENQFEEIRLEDIISNPAGTIKQICQFVGLEYEEKMATLDLSKSNSGRYKTEFSQSQIEKLNNELQDVLHEYKYD